MIASPTDLAYFVEVASTLNVTRAAERLGLAQPSLSQALKRLESSLGAQLLVRGKSGVQLTSAGRRVAVAAREHLDSWERLRNSAVDSETQVAGVYTVGCHPAVGLYALAGFLPSLMKEHPQLEVRLAHGLSRHVTEQVISWKIDFGIVVNPIAHPDLVIRELGRDEVTLWRAPGRDQVDVLFCDAELVQSQHVLRQLERKKMRFARTVTSSSLEILAELAGASGGTAILPTRVARRLGEGLKRVPGAPSFQDRVCLVYRADAPKTRANRAIVGAIQRAGI